MAMGTKNGTASSKIGEKIIARVKSHTFCPDENPESALVHNEVPRGEAPPLVAKFITGPSANPQLLQNFVVSTICTPHFGQNISIIVLVFNNLAQYFLIYPSDRSTCFFDYLFRRQARRARRFTDRITQTLRLALPLGEKLNCPSRCPNRPAPVSRCDNPDKAGAGRVSAD